MEYVRLHCDKCVERNRIYLNSSDFTQITSAEELKLIIKSNYITKIYATYLCTTCCYNINSILHLLKYYYASVCLNNNIEEYTVYNDDYREEYGCFVIINNYIFKESFLYGHTSFPLSLKNNFTISKFIERVKNGTSIRVVQNDNVDFFHLIETTLQNNSFTLIKKTISELACITNNQFDTFYKIEHNTLTKAAIKK
jgi:hypothetical protein